MLLNLVARVLPEEHENVKKFIRKARHRYERPSIIHANNEKRHHRAHGQSMLI